MLFDSFEEGFQDERTAAKEDRMVLEEHFESFTGDLPVEQEVLMVQDEQECCCARLEMLQVSTFDAEGAVAAPVGDTEGMVVDLGLLDLLLKKVVVAWRLTWSRSSRGSRRNGRMDGLAANCLVSAHKVSTTGVTDAADAVAAILPRHLELCLSRVCGSPSRIARRHWHVMACRAGDPCSEADLSFRQEREI